MFTKEMLIKRFEANNWEEIIITVGDGDQVWINPHYYGEGTPSVEDIEWFSMDSNCVRLCGSENLEKIVETLNNFSQIKAEDEKSRIELQEYFENNIQGHTNAELTLGNELYRMMWDNPEYSWETPLRKVAEDLANRFKADADKFEAALNLAECVSTYSDWYKDIWGHRPRYFLA